MKLNIVPASTGVQWFKRGVRTFFKQPLALAGLFVMFMVVMSVLSIVPVIGNVLALALLPAATLGFMAATEETAKGKFPMPTVLLSAFRAGRQQIKSMVVLGVLYALGFLLVLGISATVDGGKFAHMYLFGGSMTPETVMAADFEIAVLVAVSLYMPLSLLFWHAPALVHWHGISPVKSLFFSMVACMRNFGAFTVYSLAWLGSFITIGMGVAIVATLIGSPESVTGVMFPLAMLMAAMYFTSIYFTFKDCFDDSLTELA
jgi:hypothetical protein